MMKFQLFPTVICRTPLFSYHQTLPTVWEDLKQAIKISSPDLYNQIAKTTGKDIQSLDPKVQFACWKYFNRARYRSTPFGAFGAISIIPLENRSEEVKISAEQQYHHFVDWSQKDSLLHNTSELLAKAQYILLNSSLYICGQHYRYISVVDGHFELSSIQKQALLVDLFDYVKYKCKKSTVYHFLESRYQLQQPIIDDLLMQLIDAQLLLTDLHPNIIGTDYFQRVDVNEQNQSYYLLTERKRLAGKLSKSEFKVIPEALSHLSGQLPAVNNPNLEYFKNAFLQKFEYLQVPLMFALDPELGIGYGGFETTATNSSLIEELKSKKEEDQTAFSLSYTSLHQFILDKLVSGHKEIDLSTFDTAKNSAQKTGEVVPSANTFSAMIQLADDKIILVQAGGSTANALLGRFTLGINQIEELCQHITRQEENANPGILFFDIAYQAEKKVDNVNRRKSIYQYELPILSWSEKEDPLMLEDILVSVQNNEVILRSAKHQKRLIPRLASAYNYTRSDLALYRFFADLQNQSIQSNLTFKLAELFPGLTHYPRLSYKHLILSPQGWKVPKEITLSKAKAKDNLHKLAQWLKQAAVSPYFQCGQGDQQLYFDSRKEEDLFYFLQYCHGKTNLYIIEAFTPNEPIIKDEKDYPYLAQFIISLYHQETLYAALPPRGEVLQKSTKKILAPGSEWLYFEIYSHSVRSNLVLQRIQTFLSQIRKHLKSWFFIRYTIPAAHIRLRLQLKDKESATPLMGSLSILLKEELQDGTVTDLQIKTYIRETERYGEANIEKVERHFRLDSKYVLLLLNRNYPDELLHLFNMRFISELFVQLSLDLYEQLRFVKTMGDSLAREMNLDITGFRKINKSYQLLKEETLPLLPKSVEKSYTQMLESMAHLLLSLSPSERPKMMMNLIHMHINRLFSRDQRMHEMLIYQYLNKQLLGKGKHLSPPTPL